MRIPHSVIRRFAGLLAVIVLSAGLGGCNYKGYFQKSAYDYASRKPGDPKMSRVTSHGPAAGEGAGDQGMAGRDDRRTNPHDNRFFRYSPEASYAVSHLPGIATAIVMWTDRNAYVGLMTDWTATGTKSRGGADTQEQDNTGTTEGVYNIDTGSPRWDYRQLATPYNSYFTHRSIGDLSVELRQVVGDTVRLYHPDVEEVHISANREFVNQLLEFAKAAWSGRPLQPLTPAFNKLVSYMFGSGKEIPLPLYDQNPPDRRQKIPGSASGDNK
jgi:hypothetical protein